jgi:hypothetical protein
MNSRYEKYFAYSLKKKICNINQGILYNSRIVGFVDKYEILERSKDFILALDEKKDTRHRIADREREKKIK